MKTAFWVVLEGISSDQFGMPPYFPLTQSRTCCRRRRLRILPCQGLPSNCKELQGLADAKDSIVLEEALLPLANPQKRR